MGRVRFNFCFSYDYSESSGGSFKAVPDQVWARRKTKSWGTVTESIPVWRRWLVPGAVLIVVIVAGTIVFLGVGQWLVVQDPLDHADVIVILSGRMPQRALEAARIFHSGYADHIWISQPDSPVDDLKKMGIEYLGEDFYNEKVLLAQKVPADAIHVLEKPVANTEDEVREIVDLMHGVNAHTAIVVTSKPHTRRVRTIWGKIAPSDLHATVRFTTDDAYDGAHWWRHTSDALDVVREVLGLMNAYAGFPLRPTQS
jgi:uncharacterized SAM-binding protein YcdF (DUF218 family)